MLYGRLLYGNNVYNEEVLSAHGTVETLAAASAVRIAAASAVGVVECSALASPAVVYASFAAAVVIVSGASAAVRVISGQAVSSVGVFGSVVRTRVKYASFGQAVAIRAAYNEGIRITSAGVLYAAQGSLEWMVQPYSVTAGSPRYLFDGGGTSGQNLTVVIAADGSVQVTCGSVVITSLGTVSDDGATWVGVGWGSDGVELYLDGQLVASSTQQFTLSFGANFYVGCSASQTNSLDGLLDEFRVSSRKRSAAEFAAACELGRLGSPLEWDVDTTYLLHFDGNLNVPADRQGVWVSPVQNASTAQDYASLAVSWSESLPVGTAIACQVRTSANGVTWSAWYDQVNGQTATAPANPYSQVRFILQEVGNAGTPTLSRATVVYEGLPSASQLLSGLSVSSLYTYSQLQDYLLIFNGVDLPKKYDGTTIADITAGPRAKVTCVYKNRVWAAKGNTLYFSDLLSVDTWPAANFIEVNPSDGDEIVTLIPTSMMLIIVKQHSTYYLQGYSPDTFTVSPAMEGGTISPFGALWTPYGVFMLDREGVWQTDLRKRALLTRPIQQRWASLNQRALQKAALFFMNDILLVSVPDVASNGNNLVLPYDVYHRVWLGEWIGWNAACFLPFWERGKWKYLFGSSTTGNVFEIGEAADDAGTAFEALVETAHMPLVSEEWEKRIKWVDVYFGGGVATSDVEVLFVMDGAVSAGKVLNVPSTSETVAGRFYPPPYGRAVGVRVRWPQASNGGPELLGVTLTYYPRAPRPKEVV